MFEPAFENLRKATDATLSMQREMLTKWASLWSNVPGSKNNWVEEAQKLQKKWAETSTDMARKMQQSLEEQFQLGMRNIENTFKLAQAKDLDDLRLKTMELWQQTFEYLRKLFEIQVRDFQTALSTWTQTMTSATTPT